MDVSFHEPESYYSKRVYGYSLQGGSSSEKNMLKGEDGLMELEELSKRLQRINSKSRIFESDNVSLDESVAIKYKCIESSNIELNGFGVDNESDDEQVNEFGIS